ncbi:2-amino-4-hydroxy-6-hydroxymethyldihydropteridine diphosphokinase [Hyphomonas sp.]|uniref:2-amino-4-hydroxy-6- hydroxymethyldihydropteridine diphosphokinase n=1 Tax=Hyphomonas sp. TaxID=87 RepID=UPI003D28297A|tara:strand:- start:1439 stop:1966 length:528 start_codon:yes stop_codon:yes gene_type:complete
MTEAAIALGSNLGDRAVFLASALRAIDALPGCRLTRVSSAYRTRPWGKTDQGEFINMCALIDTDLSPTDLLVAVKDVEASMGRTASERWGPREIDIDLLIIPGVEMRTDLLTLPHPRMSERLFVIAPLAEVAPDLLLGAQRMDARAKALKAAARPNDCVVDDETTDLIKAVLESK